MDGNIFTTFSRLLPPYAYAPHMFSASTIRVCGPTGLGAANGGDSGQSDQFVSNKEAENVVQPNVSHDIHTT